jgi:hypothetical protein
VVDRIDLLIAVTAIVVTVVGSSTAQWVALSKKADKDDLRRLEARMDDGFDRLESRFELKFDRLENKFDALILRFVPEQLPRPES